MKLINTADIHPGAMTPDVQYAVYNGPWIALTRGYKALVSPEDYERIVSFRWYANVNGTYVRAARMKNRKSIYMQHEVLELTPDDLLGGQVVDHIDRNPLNNRRDNLRVISQTENMRNTLRHKHRIGVSFNARANLWCAYLDRPGLKRKYLGHRKTREEALALVEIAREAS